LGKRPFGKEPSQEVRQAKGDEERVGGGSSAEDGGDQQVAHEAEDAGSERETADGGQRAQQVHRVGCIKMAERLEL
jgi:hypothetical protein